MKAVKVMVIILMVLFPAVVLSATFEVTIDENGFNPATLMINKGDTIRWVNRGASAHNVDGAYFVSGPLQPGESFEYTFLVPSLFRYIDRATSRLASIDVQGVLLSPGNSAFITINGFDLMIISNIGEEASENYSLLLNGELFFEGNVLDLLPAGSIVPIGDGGFALKIPVSAPLPVGTYTLRIEVHSPTGRLLSLDEAVYVILAPAPIFSDTNY